MTWAELRRLQRRLASWTEKWEVEGHEVFTRVDDHGRSRRVHLGWIASQELAALVCEMHNVMAFLINALIMHRRIEQDRAKGEGNDDHEA